MNNCNMLPTIMVKLIFELIFTVNFKIKKKLSLKSYRYKFFGIRVFDNRHFYEMYCLCMLRKMFKIGTVI